jgi:hypothetical protein
VNRHYRLTFRWENNHAPAGVDPGVGRAAARDVGGSPERDGRGKRGVTADTALRLAQPFKTTPQFWIHMQANYDLKAAIARRRAMRLAGRS